MKFDKYKTKGAYHYQWYEDPNYAWYKRCVDRCVGFCKGANSVIDLGCGDGVVVSELSKQGVRATGIDPDPDAIIQAVDKSFGGSFLLAGIDEIGTREYDFITCLNVIEHLKNPQEVVIAVKNNATKGAIIITDKATEHKGRYHEHEYTKEELLDLFKEFKPEYFEINSTEFGKPITFIGVEVRK